MSFVCPECDGGTLVISHSIVFPPDNRSDDIMFQILLCTRCSFGGVAVYEESRRGSFDSESWEHFGYRISDEDWSRLVMLIARCPERGDKECNCRAHLELGQKDANGRWKPPIPLDGQHAFPMRRYD